MKIKIKNNTINIRLYQLKWAMGLGFWFGYKFSNLGYSRNYNTGIPVNVVCHNRLFTLYLPFFIIGISLYTEIE